MDRAAEDRAQVPRWLPDSFLKKDGAPDVEFEGYQYFVFPMDHGEFSRTGVIGNPMRRRRRRARRRWSASPTTSSRRSTSSARSR